MFVEKIGSLSYTHINLYIDIYIYRHSYKLNGNCNNNESQAALYLKLVFNNYNNSIAYAHKRLWL